MSRLSTSQQQQHSTNNSNNTIFLRVLSAIFYAICSITVIFVNKILLTNYRFPSFLYVAFGQMLTTVVTLYLLKRLKFLSFPKMDVSIPEKIFPLFGGPHLEGWVCPIREAQRSLNLIAGLGGTKIISLPMFTVLRRFSIFLTMLFEYFILGIIPTFGVKFSVFLMILGLIYHLIHLELGKNGLLFYNSLFMLLPLIGFILLNNEETEKLRIYIDQGYLTIPVLLFLLLSCIGVLVLSCWS
uniref:Serpentine receptor class gamma n=1 Tax=Meloidogyne floridensis TaxID=298350 RepID=A0A915NHT2_9BILA